MEKPRTARLLHQLLVLYQRVALYDYFLWLFFRNDDFRWEVVFL